MTPLHWAQSPARGVEVYSGDECIARARTFGEAYGLALAMLIGPQKIGDVMVSDERQRIRIAHAALAYLVETG
jgi:hypothetical protein